MQEIAMNIGDAFGSRFGQDLGLADLVSIILSNAVILAGVVLFFLFLIGGFMMITGAGQSDPEKAAKGQKAVTAAVIGFIIVFASYWIIMIIEKLTGFNILNPGI